MQTKAIFIDTETSGTDPQANGITQIAGMIALIDGLNIEVKERFDFDVQPFPDDVITPEALAITGKTKEQIQAYPPASVVHGDLVLLLGKYVDKYNKRDKFQFIGYNARFDMDMLRSWFKKCGDNYFGSWFHFPPIDVMNMAAVGLFEKRILLPDFKLATVANYLQIASEGEFHDAQKDIEITRQIFNHFYNLQN
jgi:DNA polymerase-3 subunit epsilon